MLSRSQAKQHVKDTSLKAALAVDNAAAKTKKAIAKGSRKVAQSIDAAADKAASLKGTVGRISRKKTATIRKAKRAASNVKAKVVQKKESTEAYVRKHPWKTIGIAALAGFIAAKILRGRRR